MLKSFFHWKVLVNLIMAIAIFMGLVWLTFRWLEFHTNHGKEIAVPNVVNKSVHDAIKILDDSGLEYEVDSFKFDPKFRPFQVLQIWPTAGSHVKDGRTIKLKVNPKTWAPVSVPDIIDKYKGLAFRNLEQVGLKVGDTLYEPSIQRDAVIRMIYNNSELKPGTLLPRFSVIDLVIGAGPKRNISVPNLVGLTVQEAKVIIEQNLFEIGLIEHEDGGKDESDIIYYQDPASLDLRDQGMQIDLWASKRTPEELSEKIKELNEIYKIKIDTTLPPIEYEEVPINNSPVYKKAPAPKKTVPKTPVEPKETEAPKSVVAPTPKPSVEKPKSIAKPEEKPKIEEKPKAKKVVVE